MKYLATLLLIFGFGLSAFGQTIKSLSYNTTNGQVVANTGTNVLTFTNSVSFKDGSNVDLSTIEEGRKISYIGESRISLDEMNFAPRVAVFDNIESPTNILVISPIAATTRTNLGLGWSALTNTNAATTLLGFDTNGQVVANTGTNVLTFTNAVRFEGGTLNAGVANLNFLNVSDDAFLSYAEFNSGTDSIHIHGTGISFGGSSAATTRANLGLGPFNGDNGFAVLTDESNNAVIATEDSKAGFYAPFHFFSDPTNAAISRANLGFSTNLNTLWTATNASNARTAIGLDWGALTNTNSARYLLGPDSNNMVKFSGRVGTNVTPLAFYSTNTSTAVSIYDDLSGFLRFSVGHVVYSNFVERVSSINFVMQEFDGLEPWVFKKPISFESMTLSSNQILSNAAITRTNFGLGWPALTNTNTSTGLLGYTTNGIVQYSTPSVTPLTFSNSGSGDSRIKLISTITDDSMNLSVNTIMYAGGLGTNWIQLDELIFRASSGSWTFHNPITFNNSTNRAATRTNLDLGATWLTNTNVTNFRSDIGLGTNAAVNFASVTTTGSLSAGSAQARIQTSSGGGIDFGFQGGSSRGTFESTGFRLNEANMGYGFGTNNTNGAAISRTNLGLPLSALTNTSTANFRSAIGVAPAPIFKVLTNDFSITNQTNMTVVDGLTFTTEANKRYVVQLFPILSASASSMPLQIVASNATVYGFWDAQATLGLSTNVITNLFGSSVTAQRALLQTFHVVAGTNNGNIAFQFATITTPNTNTIHAGSYIMAQEVVPTP